MEKHLASTLHVLCHVLNYKLKHTGLCLTYNCYKSLAVKTPSKIVKCHFMHKKKKKLQKCLFSLRDITNELVLCSVTVADLVVHLTIHLSTSLLSVIRSDIPAKLKNTMTKLLIRTIKFSPKCILCVL